MDKFKDEIYELAQQELDELIDSDFFGEDVKNLTHKFDDMENYKYFAENLDLWIEDKNQYGKDEVKSFIILFSKVIKQAFESDQKETSKQLINFFRGSEDGIHEEKISSYSEILISHKTYLDEIKRLDGQNISIGDKKRIAQLLLDAYCKGFEFISKIFNLVIILNCISEGKKIDFPKINKMSMFEKCNTIAKSKSGIKSITLKLNRHLRNATAHLNITYNTKQNKYICKRLKNGKWIKEDIDIKDMILNIYPQNGWIIQGFIYSITLYLIWLENKDTYRKYINKIFN